MFMGQYTLDASNRSSNTPNIIKPVSTTSLLPERDKPLYEAYERNKK